MAGIYIHIPFCKQACHYCNFHFSTSQKRRPEMLKAILKELELRQDYLNGKTVDTVYFGGGTPSLLGREEIELIFGSLTQYFEISEGAEITLEANPDDLSLQKLEVLKDSPVNRLSIGIQSFFDEDLKYMNRDHNAREAEKCIENALKLGFEQLTVDLIYGTPTTSDAQWKINMQKIFDFGIPHVSCYCLTVEPGTALDHFVRKGKSKPVDEEQAARQFELLIAKMEENGYEHYEISNFAKPGMYSRHNSSYRLGTSYLGLGPSAHSYDGKSRQWNVAHNGRYIKALLGDSANSSTAVSNELFEKEILTKQQLFNEYVMTSLRTIWGCSLDEIRKIEPSYIVHFQTNIAKYMKENTVVEADGVYRLTQNGKLLADRIAMELFL